MNATARADSAFGIGSTVAIAVMFALACQSLLALPYEVATLSTDYGLGPSVAGWVGTGEILALAITASWIGRVIARCDKRILTVIGLAIASAASLASIATANVPVLVGSRIVFGIGLGLIAAATSALPAAHPAPERLFAYMQVVAGCLSVAILFLTPMVVAQVGRIGLFVCELGLLVLFAPLASWLPRAEFQGGVAAIGRMPKGAVRILAALALMYVAAIAASAYAVQAGLRAGLTEGGIETVLTVGAIGSLGGAALAGAIGKRWGATPPLAVGFVAQAAGIALMYAAGLPAAFIAGALTLYVASYFTSPYLQGLLAEMDGSGRVPALGGAAINYGSVGGPALAAVLAERADAEQVIGTLTAVICLAALAAVLSVVRSTPAIVPGASS
ncbi:MFS transporter [Reyranella sp. CPCC 100927]|uniref:MFS transporter n=1 Tax=Reyranella sp. CPCC 100927 TaxID=2599616 RepID=UPI0011B82012|nr:MFS transporter [Reyranella sp. CPCC 100927]TWT11506.1 MFS transporter [Reyranella sp. CPCC 100927]